MSQNPSSDIPVPDAPTPQSERRSTPPPGPASARAVRILAKTVYKELRANGHSDADIVAFANTVLDLMTDDMTHPDQFDAS